jgi:ribonuclease HI
MNLSSTGLNQEPTEQTSQSHQQLQADEQQTDTHQGQRHHSISSGQTNRPMANQGMNLSSAGLNQGRLHGEPVPTVPVDIFLVPIPTALHGTRCYIDASTQPDQQVPVPRDAGIGIFIVDTQSQPSHSIFIKAAMKDASSVLMAEAAALALAIKFIKALSLQHVTVLSDNQQLVNFINGSSLHHPPDWRIKPLTQIAANDLQGTSVAVRRIRRQQNQMADLLARQALRECHNHQQACNFICAFDAHANECPLSLALNYVTINNVMVSTASCC